MTPVAYNATTTQAVSDVVNFLIGTLTNYAPMLLMIGGAFIIFGFLSRKLSLR